MNEPALLPKLRERLPPESRDSECSRRGFGAGGALPATPAYRYVVHAARPLPVAGNGSVSAGFPEAGNGSVGSGFPEAGNGLVGSGFPEAGNPGDAGYTLAYAGEAPFARSESESEMLAAFESALRLEVASAPSPWTFVHAGVVGWNGRAIVIPAASRHGKSRLVEALVRAGASYYSDEYAVLDERGWVHPYAKPLTLREDRGSGLRVQPDDLGATVGEEPLPIGLMIATRYEHGGGWRPRQSTRGEGVLTMLANAVRARTDPATILARATRALADAVVLEGPRGEADVVTRDLLPRGQEARFPAIFLSTNPSRCGGQHVP